MILDTLKKYATGMTIDHPTGEPTQASKRAGDGFVDDTTQVANQYPAPTDIPKLIAEVQKSAQWWEELLVATGGKLELSKCFFYLLQWVMDDKGQHHPVQHEYSLLIPSRLLS